MLRRDNNIVVKYHQKTVIGLTEPVTIVGPKGDTKEVVARIDTGATKSSIDVKLAADLSLGPIIKAKLVRSASGTGLRAVVNAKIDLADKEIKTEFTLADRSHMKYSVLIGQNILREGFLIDPSKEAEGFYADDE
jgi:hypothetical protein